MPPPIRFPFQPAAPDANAAIANALRLPGRMGALIAQQARLKPVAGLTDALAEGGATNPKPALSARHFFELGLTCAALCDSPGAIGAWRQAVRLDPDFGAAWASLADMLAWEGDGEGAASARAKCPPDIQILAHMPLAASKLDGAERLLRAEIADQPADRACLLLRERLYRAPTNAVAMRVLAELYVAQDRQSEAETLLERALALAPAYHAARFAYAGALHMGNKNAHAIPHLESLAALDPLHAPYRRLLATCLSSAGDVDRAILLFADLVREFPDEVQLWIQYATALTTAGRRHESRQAYRHCLEIAPDSGEAWWLLENLSDAPEDPADIAALRQHLAGTDMPPENRFKLHYALANALEKIGDHAESFANYAEGARIWRQVISYSAAQTTKQVSAARAYFTAERFAARQGQGCPDAAPIFILGMPRAGSTLIEQILSCHSAVEGTHELAELGHIVHHLATRASGPVFPDCLDRVDATTLATLGVRYIEITRLYRRTDRPFFIDKMPGNWAAIGLIRMMLPNAKIIDARRAPMASCFGAFKKIFGRGQNFSYDFDELGRYYIDYVGLMAHIDSVQPGAVHRVMYEDMVADTEAEIRRLLDYCGLPFEPACLRFWENPRAIRTVSAEQVRRPIYREGLDHWRHYEPWLGPLRNALGLTTE